jgi:hypothetical protein
LRLAIPRVQGISAWKETPYYLWLLVLSPFWKWRGKYNNLLWVWECPWSGEATVSRMKLHCSYANESVFLSKMNKEERVEVSPECGSQMGNLRTDLLNK